MQQQTFEVDNKMASTVVATAAEVERCRRRIDELVEDAVREVGGELAGGRWRGRASGIAANRPHGADFDPIRRDFPPFLCPSVRV